MVPHPGPRRSFYEVMRQHCDGDDPGDLDEPDRDWEGVAGQPRETLGHLCEGELPWDANHIDRKAHLAEVDQRGAG